MKDDKFRSRKSAVLMFRLHTHISSFTLVWFWDLLYTAPPFLPPNPIVHIARWDIGTSGYAAGVAKGGERCGNPSHFGLQSSAAGHWTVAAMIVYPRPGGRVRNATTDQRIGDQIQARLGRTL